MYCLWLDAGLAPAPIGFIKITTPNLAIALLKTNNVSKVSIGAGFYIVAAFCEAAAYMRTLPRLDWEVHSDGPDQIDIRQAMLQAQDYWITPRKGTRFPST